MGVIETLKDAVTVALKINNTDLNRQLLELQTQVFDLATENRTLRDRVAELQGAAKFSETLTHSAPVYLSAGDPVPYCATCWENAGKAIHLVKSTTDRNGWSCNVCAGWVEWTR